jgi:ribulose-5-phosphate 4-epimerase/fuculose-1-phosphate aldolase
MVVGASIAQTFDDLYYLERACEVQIRAESTGRRIIPIRDDVARLTAAQMRHEGGRESAKLHLESIKRVLDREAPDYRS